MSSTETAASEAAESKSAKTFVRTLRKGSETLEFRNEIKADGSVKARVIHRTFGEDGKVASTEYGGSADYASLELAKTAMGAALKQALEMGWEKPALPDLTKYHYKGKPDAFSLGSLPAPRK